MKTFREFLKEYQAISGGAWLFGNQKAKQDAVQFHKNKRMRSRMHSDYDPPDVKPSHLKKHVVKKLSRSKDHKDYTVHHVTDKTKNYTTTAALLHHKQDGFVGSLYGNKEKNEFHVETSHITKAHRGKGLGTALYEAAVKHHGSIVSDATLSVNSQRVYKHFAKQKRVSVHNPPDDSYDPGIWHVSKSAVGGKGHKEKVKLTRTKAMYSKSISPTALNRNYDYRLKIHKRKLK
jgi:GNAT superfamily N-acetyltransferase